MRKTLIALMALAAVTTLAVSVQAPAHAGCAYPPPYCNPSR